MTGLAGLKFMQRGIEKRRQERLNLLREFDREQAKLEGRAPATSGDDSKADEPPKEGETVVVTGPATAKQQAKRGKPAAPAAAAAAASDSSASSSSAAANAANAAKKADDDDAPVADDDDDEEAKARKKTTRRTFDGTGPEPGLMLLCIASLANDLQTQLRLRKRRHAVCSPARN